MIDRRPKRLEDYKERLMLPRPFKLSWEWIPELVRASLMPLLGVQPVTRTMFEVAGGTLHTAPTDGEVEYFRRKQTQFQMIQIVLSLAWWDEQDGVVSAVPYAISILPASKRGKVATVGIDYIAALGGAPVDEGTEQVYGGFDPFRGSWSIATIGGDYIAFNKGKMFLDEVGIVIDRYFLALEYDHDEVLEIDQFILDESSKRSYRRNRIKKLFTPFKLVEARRIWGIDTPIELFILQELLYRKFRPACQYLIYPNGGFFPSLYDVYADVEFRRGMNILSEVDFFFPDQRLAVFCDGATHLRAKQIVKDGRIIEQLAGLGIKSVRLSSRLINDDLKTAGDRVVDALR